MSHPSQLYRKIDVYFIALAKAEHQLLVETEIYLNENKLHFAFKSLLKFFFTWIMRYFSIILGARCCRKYGIFLFVAYI